jgi:hypothetical protein
LTDEEIMNMYQETPHVRRRLKKPKVITFDDTNTRKEKIIMLG